MKTVDIRLPSDERDFILELLHEALGDELVNKIELAIMDLEGYFSLSLSLADFKVLTAQLMREANHHGLSAIQEKALSLAETLEAFTLSLSEIDKSQVNN